MAAFPRGELQSQSHVLGTFLQLSTAFPRPLHASEREKSSWSVFRDHLVQAFHFQWENWNITGKHSASLQSSQPASALAELNSCSSALSVPKSLPSCPVICEMGVG